MQKVVSLSSTKAEWYSLSEAVKDIVVLINLCKSLQLQVRLPVTVRVNNTGTNFMSNNVQTSSRTWHIRSSDVREYVEDGVIRIIFVPTGENDSDILTKNVNGKLLAKTLRGSLSEGHKSL